MCTAIRYQNKDHYFGRNLDADFSFNERVVITPRNHLFSLRNGTEFKTKFAMIGVATVLNDQPLYYEAANEKGLAVAGLNFPGNAEYLPPQPGRTNLASFEFLPWLLGQAQTVSEVRELLKDLVLTNIPFSAEIPVPPLHFMISDRECSIVVEPRADGLHVYENPFDVITNNPPFDFHLWNMRQYRHLSPSIDPVRFSQQYPLEKFCVGMGSIGLPGDTSSASRFVRTAFNLTNSKSEPTEESQVSQFFHVLDSVAMVRGSTVTPNGTNDITLYSCCINLDKGILYYKTYDNSQLTAICMDRVDLDADHLYVYNLVLDQQIRFDN